MAAAAAAAKSLQSCLTLCDPIDGSPPGSPIPGILQARVLEWGAIAFSETHLEEVNFWMNGVVPNLWHCFMTYEVDHFPKQLITSVKFFEVTDISLP